MSKSWLTQEAADRLSAELASLETTGRSEIIKKIESARSEGDLKENGGYQLLHEQEGDTISEVLSYVEYEPKDIINRFKSIVEDAVRSRDLSLSERKELTQSFKESISGYTYFEK